MPFTEAGLAGVQTERDGGGSATPGGLARRRASRGGGTTGLLTWSPQAYLNMRTDPTPTTKGSAKATGRDMGVVEPRQKGPTPLTPGDRQRKEMLDPQKPHGGLNEEQTGTQPAKLASPWADLASIYKATSPPSPIPSTARAPCGRGLSQASAQGPNTGDRLQGQDVECCHTRRRGPHGPLPRGGSGKREGIQGPNTVGQGTPLGFSVPNPRRGPTPKKQQGTRVIVSSRPPSLSLLLSPQVSRQWKGLM